MNLVSKIGSVKVVKDLNIRKGQPITTLPVARKALVGEVLKFTGWVTDGENVAGNAKWFQMADGNFFWSGNVEVLPEPAAVIPNKVSVTACTWKAPVPNEYFNLSQTYLNEDWNLYPKFGHHTGVDYGGHRKAGIALFACADGEIIYRDVASSAWGASLGNHCALYVPSVDKTFVYCHLEKEPHQLGLVKAGDQLGIMGCTGKSAGGAIHLHLEGFNGRFNILQRTFLSMDDIKTKTFDADKFIRTYLHG